MSIDDKEVVNVPCDGCTLCCLGDAVRILPHEDPAKWVTEPHFIYKGARMLRHKPDGSCVYLAERGCSIWDDRPQMCGELDCRIFAELSFTRARKLAKKGVLRLSVWRRGKDLAKR